MIFSIRTITITTLILSVSSFAYKQSITKPFQTSGDKSTLTLNILSFQPTQPNNTIIPYNGNTNCLVNRFDNYRMVYAAGQGAHAFTRILSVLNR